jgi:hypothetical protein
MKELVTLMQCVIITTRKLRFVSSSDMADVGAMKIISKVSKNVIKYAAEFFKEKTQFDKVLYYIIRYTTNSVVVVVRNYIIV